MSLVRALYGVRFRSILRDLPTKLSKFPVLRCRTRAIVAKVFRNELSSSFVRGSISKHSSGPSSNLWARPNDQTFRVPVLRCRTRAMVAKVFRTELSSSLVRGPISKHSPGPISNLGARRNDQTFKSFLVFRIRASDSCYQIMRERQFSSFFVGAISKHSSGPSSNLWARPNDQTFKVSNSEMSYTSNCC